MPGNVLSDTGFEVFEIITKRTVNRSTATLQEPTSLQTAQVKVPRTINMEKNARRQVVSMIRSHKNKPCSMPSTSAIGENSVSLSPIRELPAELCDLPLVMSNSPFPGRRGVKSREGQV